MFYRPLRPRLSPYRTVKKQWPTRNWRTAYLTHRTFAMLAAHCGRALRPSYVRRGGGQWYLRRGPRRSTPRRSDRTGNMGRQIAALSGMTIIASLCWRALRRRHTSGVWSEGDRVRRP